VSVRYTDNLTVIGGNVSSHTLDSFIHSLYFVYIGCLQYFEGSI